MFVNFLAVFVCALLTMGIGYLWYSPKVFGSEWIRLSKIDQEGLSAMTNAKSMRRQYITQFIGSFLIVYVLAQFVALAGADGLIDGMRTGFWVWLGFVAPIMVGSVVWEGKPWRLFFINAGQYFAVLIIMGAILAQW